MINRQVERIQTPLSLLWLAWSKATAVTWPCPRLWKEGGTVYILAIALIRGKEHPALGELSKSIWLHRFYHERFLTSGRNVRIGSLNDQFSVLSFFSCDLCTSAWCGHIMTQWHASAQTIHWPRFQRVRWKQSHLVRPLQKAAFVVTWIKFFGSRDLQRFAEKVGNMLGFSLALTAWCKTNLLAPVDRKVVHPHQVCFGACWSLFQASYKSLNTRQTKHSKTAFTALTTWQQFVCCAATRLHRTQGSKKQQRTWQLGASRHADFFEG